MLILVHRAPASLEEYRHPALGILSSPDRWYRDVDGWSWAADNGAFSGFDELAYREMLDGLAELPSRPKFVTLPDVVGDAHETLMLGADWLPELRRRGLPVGFVAQDGLEVDTTPWAEIDAVFIGGTSEFKMGDEAREIGREAKRRGKWLHMGRVNGHQRVRYAKAIGCDSVDGTSMSWFRDRWLRAFLEHANGPTQGILV